jgi:hypothetical protein
MVEVSDFGCFVTLQRLFQHATSISFCSINTSELLQGFVCIQCKRMFTILQMCFGDVVYVGLIRYLRYLLVANADTLYQHFAARLCCIFFCFCRIVCFKMCFGDVVYVGLISYNDRINRLVTYRDVHMNGGDKVVSGRGCMV